MACRRRGRPNLLRCDVFSRTSRLEGRCEHRQGLNQGERDCIMSSTNRMDVLPTAGDVGSQHPMGVTPAVVPPKRSMVRRWLLQDSPYITMLLLALVGVAFHMQPGYWAILTPVFGIICIIAGWHRFPTRAGRLQLVYTQVLSWFALIFTIYILYFNIVQGVINTIATSLAMLTLLALGTFMAGLNARVWRICAVGAILLCAVPAMGWLEQSVLFVAIAILIVVLIGFLTWWLGQRRKPVA
jgi:hypothetical protein